MKLQPRFHLSAAPVGKAGSFLNRLLPRLSHFGIRGPRMKSMDMHFNLLIPAILVWFLSPMAVALEVAHGQNDFNLSSPAFPAGGAIPQRYTCEGRDISPPLAWQGVPDGTLGLVLMVDDPDAPDPAAPRMVWVHWLVYNLPPDSQGLQEGIPESGLPPPAVLGRNDFRRTGYGGPCPPIGTHRYFFKLYALDTQLPRVNAPTKAVLLAAMEGHIIAQAELMGTYAKHRGRPLSHW